MDPRLEPIRATEDPLKRHAGFMALLSDEFRARGLPPPIVVGGHALEIYTRGAYQSRDIDLVTGHREALDEICRGLGFTKVGRHWAEPELRLAVEAPGTEVPERVVEVLFDGIPVRVLSIEELTIDRLAAYVHWKSERDGDWAVLLLRLHGAAIDWPFLERRAREEDVSAALDAARRQVAAADGARGKPAEERGA